MTKPDDIDEFLAELANGKVPPDLVSRVTTLGSDPSRLARLIEGMKTLGFDQLYDPLEDIAAYYSDGPNKYDLRWPLSFKATAELFSVLDPKLQFHVLFREWSVREVEGTQFLLNGDTTAAQAAYEECLARAEQLAVPELTARSFDGMMRIAQRLGNARAAVEYSRRAEALRDGTLNS